VAHGSTWFDAAADCCRYEGLSARLLAFEYDERWNSVLDDFRACTGAEVNVEYNGGGLGDEDSMASDLLADLGSSHLDAQLLDSPGAPAASASAGTGQNIFDAYIVQPPWLPKVFPLLDDLTPWVREHPSLDWTDVNAATRQVVTWNSTVRALPLDTDYIAMGLRQDVLDAHGESVPQTIEELVAFSERMSGRDHNGDGEPDWGICLTPQVNYFMAFAAPLLQTDPTSGVNMFFDSNTFEPMVRSPAFAEAARLFYRLLASSNCPEQVAGGVKCSRKTAFPTGRCAGTISMPGTLTKMLVPGKSLTIANTSFMAANYTDPESDLYWGRRYPFPGSERVLNRATGAIEPCTAELCPSAKPRPTAAQPGRLVNFAPFFSEGGESYALRGSAAAESKEVMRDLFGWMASLPVELLPLSGQYRKSHLTDEAERRLVDDNGWPRVAAEDLHAVLDDYFADDANAAKDLLIIGSEEYTEHIREQLIDRLLLEGAVAGRPLGDIEPELAARIDAVAAGWDQTTATYGVEQQLTRWRAAQNLQAIPCAEIMANRRAKGLSADECAADTSNATTEPAETWVGLTVGLSVFAVLAIVAGVVWQRHHRAQQEYLRLKESELYELAAKVRKDLVGQLGDPSRAEYAQKAELGPDDKLELGAELGRGAFGTVHRGTLHRTNGQGAIDVAVKQMSGSGSRLEQEAFLYEAQLLAMLSHAHIVRLEAVRVRHSPLMIVMEVLPGGDLLSYLRKSDGVDPATGAPFSVDTLTRTARNVASGMSYLSSFRIVHRDLAARNVLVGAHVADVRLADFGLSRQLRGGTDYYRKQSNDKVPVKWMPLEAIQHRKYSEASDVYSFGVLTWELFTLGEAPWATLSPVEAVLAVATGSRLARPERCSEDIYTMMMACWAESPFDRPQWMVLNRELDRMLGIEPGTNRGKRGSRSVPTSPSTLTPKTITTKSGSVYLDGQALLSKASAQPGAGYTDGQKLAFAVKYTDGKSLATELYSKGVALAGAGDNVQLLQPALERRGSYVDSVALISSDESAQDHSLA